MLRQYLQKKALEKDKSAVPTSFVPFERIKKVTLLLDANDIYISNLENLVQEYFLREKKDASIFFLDLRKLRRDDILLTSSVRTFYRKELNFYGKPVSEKFYDFLKLESDLFVNLTKDTGFVGEYIASCCNAHFKVGRDNLEVYNLVIDGKAGEPITQAQAFEEIAGLLGKFE